MLFHAIVLVWGFTGVLGNLISISAIPLVFWRMGIAALGLLLIVNRKIFSVKLSFADLGLVIGTGIIVALHWITFFHAIKISTVSLALCCMASGTLFTALLEPLSKLKLPHWLEPLIGVVIIAGLLLIFKFEFQHKWGILTALLSAFLASIFTVINKHLVARIPSGVISFYEMLAGFVVIAIAGYFLSTDFYINIIPKTSDLLWLLLLGLVCTAVAFAVSVEVMKHLSAYTVALAINLEPIYAIVLALLIFGDSEKMTSGFYFGAAVILLGIFGYPVIKRKLKIA